jgi:outer membrane biosynthesis protein TonB
MTVLDTVTAAIQQIGGSKGASRVAIKKVYAANTGKKVEDVPNHLLRKAIKSGVEKGILVEGKTKGVFKVDKTKLPKAPKKNAKKPAKKKVVKKKVAKKPAAAAKKPAAKKAAKAKPAAKKAPKKAAAKKPVAKKAAKAKPAAKKAPKKKAAVKK